MTEGEWDDREGKERTASPFRYYSGQVPVLTSMNRHSNDHRCPDISDILVSKAEGRKILAALPFGRKVEILEEMRARVEPIRGARDARRSPNIFGRKG
jgi:hypothetical protein